MPTKKRLDLRKENLDELGALASSADKLVEIVSAAAKMPRQVGIRRAAQELSSVVGVDESELNVVLGALLNFYHTQTRLKLEPSETAKVIAENMERLAKTEEDRARLALWKDASNKIAMASSKLSKDHPLEDAYKAHQVISGRQYELWEARIFTDLRPVFNEAGDAITQGVITHILYLHFHDGSNHHEMEIRLDALEVTELKQQCERAERKSAVLKKDLKNQQWPISIFREPTGTNEDQNQ